MRLGLFLVLAWISIELHELGHLLVYWLSGHGAWVSFQRIHVIGEVSGELRLWAKPAGPLISLLAGLVFFLKARKEPSFLWVTAAFTNASFRIFPCMMAIYCSLAKAQSGFSDEGDVVFALSSDPLVRISLVSTVLVPALALTFFSAREYRFIEKPWLKSISLYLASFSVAILAFKADAFFGFDK